MVTPDNQSGTLRSDYETDRARLDNFPALEYDWQELLNRLTAASGNIRYRDGGREGTLACLWANHVLTVLVEINLTDVSGEQFVKVSGTATQTVLSVKLYNKVNEWIVRLNSYIGRNRRMGQGGSSPTLIAIRVKEQLEDTLSAATGEEKQDYYHRLRIISNIRELWEYNLQQIKDSGDMDGSLSLLLAYIWGYSGIAQAFNNRLAALPELYRREILYAVPRGVTQDSVYIIMTPPEEGAPGYTLPTGHAFIAGQTPEGEDLLYQTLRPEYITPMQCAEVNAVFVDRNGGKATDIRKQPIGLSETSAAQTLFAAAHSQTCP